MPRNQKHYDARMRSTRAIIHLDHFRHNLGIIQALCPSSRLCLAVKADAYGHGAVPIARTAIECGVQALGVATVGEGLALRQAGIMAPILLYGIADTAEMVEAISSEIELFCADHEHLQTVISAAKTAGRRARIHLKVDTGMGRIGCPPNEARQLARASQNPLIGLHGICTHLPLSEDPDSSFTRQQIERFNALVDEIRADGIDPGLVHSANSGGLGLFPEARLDMVRPGIMAYGYPPGPDGFGHLDLRPVMELRSAISFIKPVAAGTALSYGLRYRTSEASWIGTVPLGYADGLPRLASGKLHFTEIPGSGPTIQTATSDQPPRGFPQVGTICMDQCLVNLGPVNPAQPDMVPTGRWSEVVIFGPPPARETAATIAASIGTIPYEITCGISARVPRVYVGGSGK